MSHQGWCWKNAPELKPLEDDSPSHLPSHQGHCWWHCALAFGFGFLLIWMIKMLCSCIDSSMFWVQQDQWNFPWWMPDLKWCQMNHPSSSNESFKQNNWPNLCTWKMRVGWLNVRQHGIGSFSFHFALGPKCHCHVLHTQSFCGPVCQSLHVPLESLDCLSPTTWFLFLSALGMILPFLCKDQGHLFCNDAANSKMDGTHITSECVPQWEAFMITQELGGFSTRWLLFMSIFSNGLGKWIILRKFCMQVKNPKCWWLTTVMSAVTTVAVAWALNQRIEMQSLKQLQCHWSERSEDFCSNCLDRAISNCMVTCDRVWSALQQTTISNNNSHGTRSHQYVTRPVESGDWQWRHQFWHAKFVHKWSGFAWNNWNPLVSVLLGWTDRCYCFTIINRKGSCISEKKSFPCRHDTSSFKYPGSFDAGSHMLICIWQLLETRHRHSVLRIYDDPANNTIVGVIVVFLRYEEFWRSRVYLGTRRIRYGMRSGG